jgi:hypothetical protein
MSDKTPNFDQEMQELADVLAQYAPENWQQMNLNYKTFDECDVSFESWVDVNGEKTPIDIDEEDIDKLETIFINIKVKAVANWKSAKFHFTIDGDCEIDFEY